MASHTYAVGMMDETLRRAMARHSRPPTADGPLITRWTYATYADKQIYRTASDRNSLNCKLV